MVKAITKENKNAQIISVKVLDKNGEGSVSSIVSGIAYAEKRGASIVNLSLSGLATAGNSVVTAAVNDAIAKRMIVVGAAGNNGRDAKYYIPGAIADAIIVGAIDEDKVLLPSSNYGNTVDAYAIADSTSEAAAMMSGFFSKKSSANNLFDDLDKHFALPYQVKNGKGKKISDVGEGFKMQSTKENTDRLYTNPAKGRDDKKKYKTLTQAGQFKGITRKKVLKAIDACLGKWEGTEYGEARFMPSEFQCGGWVGWCLWAARHGNYTSTSSARKTYAMNHALVTRGYWNDAIKSKNIIYSFKNADDIAKAGREGKIHQGDLILMINIVGSGKETRDDKGILQKHDDHVAFYYGNERNWNQMVESGYIEWNTPRFTRGGFYIDPDGEKVGPYQQTPGVHTTFIHAKQPSRYFVLPWNDDETPPNHTYVSAKKKWNDDGNSGNKRPTSITVKLQRKVKGGDWENVKGYTDITLNSSNKWTYPKEKVDYDNADGDAYSYRWVEKDVPDGYLENESTKTKSTTDSDGSTTYSYETTITNRLTTKYTSIEKEWDGFAGEPDDPQINGRSVEVMFRMNPFNEKMRGWKMKADNSGYAPDGTGDVYPGDWYSGFCFGILSKERGWSYGHGIPDGYSETWTEFAWKYVDEGDDQWKLFVHNDVGQGNEAINQSDPLWGVPKVRADDPKKETTIDGKPISSYSFISGQSLPGCTVTFKRKSNDATKVQYDQWVGTNQNHKMIGSTVQKSFEQIIGQTAEGPVTVGLPVAAVDSVQYQLYCAKGDSDDYEAYTDTNHPTGWVVTLNDANNWTAGTGESDLPFYDTPDSASPNNEDDMDAHTIHYEWREVPNSLMWRGINVSGIQDSTSQYTAEPDPDNDDDHWYTTTSTDVMAGVDMHTSAVDGKSLTKAGVVGSTSIIDTVTFSNIAPRLTYQLTAQLYTKDGNPLTVDGNAITATSGPFQPQNENTYVTNADGTTSMTKNLTLNVNAKDLENTDVVVYEWLTVTDENNDQTTLSYETDASDEDQTIHYPKVRTHMISDNPSKNYGHTMDGVAGDNDGKHFGTLQQSPNGTVSMTDTVSYTNLVRGYTYTVHGVLHRRGRTYNTGEDLGVVTVDGNQVTADSSFTVPGGDGPTASGTVNVTYRFRFPENLYGGDYVSFETLRYTNANGQQVDLTSHADISDGSQTVRMPTSFRVDKRDADTDQPVADVTYQLFTKDSAGNLIAYKKDDGNDYILTTGAGGTVEFRDLDIGTYWVVERKTPRKEGKRYYSLQKSAFEMKAVESRVNSKKNTNFTTPELTTGGRGTTIFYIAATAVAGSCVVAYVIRKRKHE